MNKKEITKKWKNFRAQVKKVPFSAIVQTSVIILLVTIATLMVFSNFETPLKMRSYAVLSGSMRPTIPLGSVVFVRSSTDYFANDIITFRNLNSDKTTVTHRIVSVQADPDINKYNYTTKGDANEDNDVFITSKQQVIGKMIFWLPLLGYLVVFVKTQIGFTLLVVVPATILIYSEVKNIISEILKAKKARKKVRKTVEVLVESK